MDFKYNLNVERIKDADKKVNETRDGFGSKSGFYLTLIEYIAVITNDKGSKTLNFKLSNQDRSSSIVAYLRMTNNDGKPSFQAPLLDKLIVESPVDLNFKPEYDGSGSDLDSGTNLPSFN